MEGYLWDRPEAKEAFKLAARIARGAGRQTSITLSDSFCVERHRESFLDLIRNDIDIVFANEAETKSLYQTQNFDGAMKAIARDCPVAVLTRSEKGCIVLRGEEVHAIPAHPVSKVVDVTGAGDLFAAGFLRGFTSGRTLPEAARLGSVAAAEVISHVGARPEINLGAHVRALGLL
jgi:sugar/nucleoside kinase (ribokinase family)